MNERSFENFCKRLANRARLDVLRQVILSDDGLSVNDIADLVRLKQPATSQYLAQLEGECGLVRAEREGRYVIYRFSCDGRLEAAAQIGPAIRKYFRDEASAHHFLKRRMEDPAFLRTMEALGNATRAKVAALLRKRRAMSKPDVKKALELSDINARRHLGTLCDLGLIESTDDGFRWLEPSDAISRMILDFLAPVTYCNK